MKKKTLSGGGPKGPAKSIRRLKDGLKIVAVDGTEYGPFSEDRVSEDIADALFNADWKALPDVFFSLNANGDFIYDIHPLDGFHYLRFMQFGHQKDKPPMSKSHTDGWGNTFLRFWAEFQIIGGKYAGLRASKWYKDLFIEDPDDGLAMLAGGSVWVGRLEKMMVLAGFTEPKDDFKYEVNCLPILEARLLKYNNVFGATFSEGWVNELSVVDEDIRPKAPAR